LQNVSTQHTGLAGNVGYPGMFFVINQGILRSICKNLISPLCAAASIVENKLQNYLKPRPKVAGKLIALVNNTKDGKEANYHHRLLTYVYKANVFKTR